MKRLKVLVVTDDALGKQMAGPAIRAWNIADVLADDHDVRLASTLRAQASSPRFAVCDGSPHMLPGLATGVDVIITQGFTLKYRPWLAQMGAKMIVDLYDPIHLETLEGEVGQDPAEQRRRVAGTLDALRVQIEAGDFFVCASERQRDLWLGHLSALGRVNVDTYRQDSSLRKLIDIAPFGIDPHPPQRRIGVGIKGVVPGIEQGDTVLLWAGGVYNWFDPVTLIDAVGDLAATHPRLKLLFMGTKHPSLDDLSTTVLRRGIDTAERRGLLNRQVFFREGWVPYADRGAFLADADIGVSCHQVHAETAYSFRTRMLDYLWAGLPIVCTEGDEFARLVAEEGLGRVVRARDRAGWAAALIELVESPAELERARAAVSAVAPRYYWHHALAPIEQYCRAPWRAADQHSHPTVGAGRAARWGARLDDRVAHVKEYARVNGWARLLRRAAQRGALRLLRPLRGAPAR